MIDLLLSPDPTLVTELQALSAATTKDAIPNGYRLAECNSFFKRRPSATPMAPPSGSSTFSFANAQYAPEASASRRGRRARLHAVADARAKVEDRAGLNVHVKQIDMLARAPRALHLLLRGTNATERDLDELIRKSERKDTPFSSSDIVHRVARIALTRAYH